MSITVEQSFAIFSGQLKRQQEALDALEALQPEDKELFAQHAEGFQEAAAKIGIMAQLEMGELVEKNQTLLAKPADKSKWTIGDWRDFLDAIEGTHFEQMHLLATMDLNMNSYLLEKIKP